MSINSLAQDEPSAAKIIFYEMPVSERVQCSANVNFTPTFHSFPKTLSWKDSYEINLVNCLPSEMSPRGPHRSRNWEPKRRQCRLLDQCSPFFLVRVKSADSLK